MPLPARFARLGEDLRARLEQLGGTVTGYVVRLGFAARFFAYLVMHSGTALKRFQLTIHEIYFAGVLSLVIILVSGLFVGMVLALQGYETLQRFGASESLGVLVALSLVRELGPVVAGLLFASRDGSAITAEIGLMKATEQLSAMEMMAVDPIARVLAPRFWGGVLSDRKSTRLNSSHVSISYAVFCLKKKRCECVNGLRWLSLLAPRHCKRSLCSRATA